MPKSNVRNVLILLAGLAGLVVFYFGVLQFDRAYGSRLTEHEVVVPSGVSLIELAPDMPDALRLTESGMKIVGIETVPVKIAPPPEPLRLPGSILLDPNQLVRIHARFPGELVALGTVPIPAEAIDPPTDANGVAQRERPLRFGDRVTKGQIIAVVWSKDIGEKKSELVDAISKSAIDKTLLDKLEKVERGVVPESTIQDAKRNYFADVINIERAERTLRSWRLTDEEIDGIRGEAARIHNRQANDPSADRTWAETEVRSPIDGVVVEKNFNVGDIIDPSQDLFKIADLTRVQVLASAYEEDLPLLRSLPPEARHWQIDVKSDPNDEPVEGPIDTIGSIIDPAQHAGAVMGMLDNPGGRLNVGQFVTVTIALPADPSLVMVPTSALIEDGTCPKVFVETNAELREFSCRRVAVVDRARDKVYLRGAPKAAESACGAASIQPGQRVIKSGVLELAAELKSRQAAAREQEPKH